jgi:predicted flap endonuclease-1-like 5' DNA nuclease
MRRIFRAILAVMLGYYIIEWWLNQQKSPVSSDEAVPSIKPNPPSSKSNRDPLAELDGIGPAYERALNALGIHTFAQLASQNPDDLAMQLASVRVTAARIRRDRWIEQAAAHANLPVQSTRWSANDGNSA